MRNVLHTTRVTALRAFDPAEPPREVPLLVRARVLFGGPLAQGGWMFFGFGMIFVWLFAAEADLTSWYHFRGRLETAGGVATGCEKTNYSEGGSGGGSSSRSGTPVYANHYMFCTFSGEEATEHYGTSYALGQQLQPGALVQIEYPAGRPELARIVGMRRAPVGPVALITVIFPLIGLGLILGSLPRRLRGVRLLRDGLLGHGVLKSKEPTNTKVNKQTVYRYTFEFIAEDGQSFTATARTHTAELEDEAEEPLLYDPLNPSYAVMLDELPGGPRIDQNGRIRAGGLGVSLAVLIIPALTIIGHGTWLFLRLAS